MSTTKIPFVQSLYAAFQRGDIQTILQACAPDITWGIMGRKQDLPMLGIGNGKAAVTDFFKTMDEIHEITEFEPKIFQETDDKVFVWGRYRWIMRNNNCPGEIEWLHIFTFRDGKVVSWRGHNDTAHLVAAYRAAPVTAARRASA